jgi:hypothetical protein
MMASRWERDNELQPNRTAHRFVLTHNRVRHWLTSSSVSPEQPLMTLVSRARTRSDAVVAQIAAALRADIPGYRPGEGLSDEELHDQISSYFADVLDHIGGAPEPGPGALDPFMRAKFDAGITLTSLLHSYRLGVATAWNALAELARRNDRQKDALVAATPAMFGLMNAYSTRAHAVYREIEIRDARRNEQIRASMLDTVLSENSSAGADFWDAVTILGIPRTGQFAVVIAATHDDETVDDEPADIEVLITSHPAVEEAWFRLSPRAQVGLVSFRRNKISALDGISDTVTQRVPVCLGVSIPFTSVADSAKARTQAQVAASAASAARPAIRYNRDVLPVLMASSPDAAATVITTTLGPVLQLAPERRDPLIDTVRAWLRLGQSVSATAAELHCHRNTVNYRLRRFAELTGGSLSDNVWLSQVVLAVQAPLPT